jgi:pyruvate/2-oxoglutarate dehydrogenase complex dihydrolipoamide acyltransferase (E2) component
VTAMTVDVFVPKVTEFMDEATIVRWLVAEGDHVLEGDPLFEMETDKVSVTVDAPAAGWIKGISPEAAAAGVVPVGRIIAYIVATPDQETPRP